jgi:predicted AlkP superfamily pyrophosphatase or phosphodiesterase
MSPSPAWALLLVLACRTAPSEPTFLPEPSPPIEPDPGLPPDGRALLLISVDGLRPADLERTDLPGFSWLASGVSAEGLQPPFPSYTFPSHYSIVTGLHAEDHGIVSNVFYDPVRQEQFKLGDPDDMTDAAWWGGEPIWNTVEAQGGRSFLLFWPGSEAPIGGVTPSVYTRYDAGLSHNERVDRVLGWLSRPAAERPTFATLYVSAVDSAGHAYGPGSPEVVTAVSDVDRMLTRLLDGLQRAGLTDKVDIVLVSDHGMAAKDPERVVFTDGVLDPDAQVVEWSPLLVVNPRSSTADDLAARLDALEHLSCATRENTPPDWHYRKHRAIGAVVCLADNGWLVSGREYYTQNLDRFRGGTHGWDPEWEEMRGVFLARGPRVREGVRLGVLHAVDVYPVLTNIMGLKPAPHAGDPSVADQVVAPER